MKLTKLEKLILKMLLFEAKATESSETVKKQLTKLANKIDSENP